MARDKSHKVYNYKCINNWDKYKRLGTIQYCFGQQIYTEDNFNNIVEKALSYKRQIPTYSEKI